MTESRRARKKAANRSALTGAARTLFASKGLYSTTVEDVTEAADLAKGTFYAYFSSRDDLIAELVRETLCELVDEAKAASTAVRLPAEAAGKIVSAHQRYFASRPDAMLLLHQARGWAKLPSGRDSHVRSEFRLYVERLADLLIASGARGRGWTRRRARSLASTLAGCIFGVMSFQAITMDPGEKPGDLAAAVRTLGLFLPPAKAEKE